MNQTTYLANSNTTKNGGIDLILIDTRIGVAL